MVDDREANVRQLAESIESGNTGDISDVLHEGEGCCQNRTPDPDSRSIVCHGRAYDCFS